MKPCPPSARAVWVPFQKPNPILCNKDVSFTRILGKREGKEKYSLLENNQPTLIMNGHSPPYYIAHAEGPSASVNIYYSPKLDKNDISTNMMGISLMNLNAESVHTEKAVPRKRRVEWTVEVRRGAFILVVGAVAVKSCF